MLAGLRRPGRSFAPGQASRGARVGLCDPLGERHGPFLAERTNDGVFSSVTTGLALLHGSAPLKNPRHGAIITALPRAAGRLPGASWGWR